MVSRIGVLLANTGTTEAPRPKETRRYLREFLSDPRVLDVPAPVRWFVLNAFILPFRPKKSAEAYAAVWRPDGSPLSAFSNALCAALRGRMPEYDFAVGMRYGRPSLSDAFSALMKRNPERIIIAPLFPQYASAATGSVLERVYELAGRPWNVPSLTVLPPFYDAAGFLDAWQAVATPVLDAFRPDHVLLSYHGLPERHVKKSDPSGAHCFARPDCCDSIGDVNRYCYRAQCLATSRGLMDRLGLGSDRCSTSFQSRLGSDPWLTPATDIVVPEFAQRGIKRLAVLCPAFTADCLETLEEIGIRARESFIESGGEDLVQVPCLNDHPAWVEALERMLRRL